MQVRHAALSTSGSVGHRGDDLWETALRSCLANGDGARCPIHWRCPSRRAGHWCVDDDWELVKRALDPPTARLGDCSFVGPSCQCMLLQLLDLLACDWISRAGIKEPPVPDALVGLADATREITTWEVPLKAYHGATWSFPDQWIIQLNAQDGSSVKRFTLFHEAFHICARGAWPATTRGRSRRLTEMLAELFAVCLITPVIWLEDQWNSSRDVNQITEIFNSPEAVVGFRVRQLGLNHGGPG